MERSVKWLTVLFLAFHINSKIDAAPKTQKIVPPGWTTLAKRLFNNMNTSVAPCDNFYEFACGGWMKENELGPKELAVSTTILAQRTVLNTVVNELNKLKNSSSASPRIMQQAMIYYNLCTGETSNNNEQHTPKTEQQGLDLEQEDQNNVQHLYDLIKDYYFDWPFLEQGQHKAVNISYLLGRMLGTFSRSSLLEIRVSPDYKEPSRVMLTMIPPIASYGNDDIDTTAESIERMALLFREVEPATALNQTLLKRDALNMAQLSAAVHNAAQSAMRHYDPDLPFPYNVYNLTTMNSKWPHFKVNQFFKGLGEDNLNETAVSPNSVFSVAFPEYLQWLDTQLEFGVLANNRDAHNLLVWTLVRAQIHSLPSLAARVFGKAHMDREEPVLKRALLSETSTDLKCAQNLMFDLPYVVGRLYAENANVSAQFKEQNATVSSITTGLIAAFKSVLSNSDWLKADSRLSADLKSANMLRNLGYPLWIFDNAQLDSRHSALDLNAHDDKYTAMNKLLRFSIWTDLQKLNLPNTDRHDFAQSPATVNAWYQTKLNSLTLPIGLYQHPLLDVSYPPAVNYGMIGALGGHELTHGFDQTGIHWDYDGTFRESASGWLDKDSYVAFKQMVLCIERQYNKCCLDDLGCVNGNRTASENIADNGGLSISWSAYQTAMSNRHIAMAGALLPSPMSEFSMQQVFFISFAQMWCENASSSYSKWQMQWDVHSPAPCRVNTAVHNMAQFHQAFRCPQPTNSTCQVWQSTQ